MDEWQLEIAARNEQAAREEAEKAAHLAMVPETHPFYDGKHCVGCGEPILKARREMGKVRCVPCQTFKERRR